jgi:hypothetical protein
MHKMAQDELLKYINMCRQIHRTVRETADFRTHIMQLLPLILCTCRIKWIACKHFSKTCVRVREWKVICVSNLLFLCRGISINEWRQTYQSWYKYEWFEFVLFIQMFIFKFSCHYVVVVWNLWCSCNARCTLCKCQCFMEYVFKRIDYIAIKLFKLVKTHTNYFTEMITRDKFPF